MALGAERRLGDYLSLRNIYGKVKLDKRFEINSSQISKFRLPIKNFSWIDFKECSMTLMIMFDGAQS